VPTLLSTLAALKEAELVSASDILITGYIASMAVFVIGGARRWRSGPRGFLARPANWNKGTYDVGALAAFFFGVRLGQAEQSDLATDDDKTWFKKHGWLLYSVLFLTPIVAAWVLTHGVDAGALPWIMYCIALFSGLAAANGWIMCGWYWKWGRARGCPMLVKQFAHRYKRTK
jgi:hypothetical protein